LVDGVDEAAQSRLHRHPFRTWLAISHDGTRASAEVGAAIQGCARLRRTAPDPWPAALIAVNGRAVWPTGPRPYQSFCAGACLNIAPMVPFRLAAAVLSDRATRVLGAFGMAPRSEGNGIGAIDGPIPLSLPPRQAPLPRWGNGHRAFRSSLPSSVVSPALGDVVQTGLCSGVDGVVRVECCLGFDISSNHTATRTTTYTTPPGSTTGISRPLQPLALASSRAVLVQGL
jgi:hypothetical protein